MDGPLNGNRDIYENVLDPYNKAAITIAAITLIATTDWAAAVNGFRRLFSRKEDLIESIRFETDDIIDSNGNVVYSFKGETQADLPALPQPSGVPSVGSTTNPVGNILEGGSGAIVNSKGVTYPEVIDIRTGQNMVFPEGVNSRIPKESRVGWYRNQTEANLYRVNDTDILCKKDYIDEWYRRGYQTPEGGWDLYEIHHIKPREFGGSADFDNMVPLLKDVHRKVVTPWWNGFD